MAYQTPKFSLINFTARRLVLIGRGNKKILCSTLSINTQRSEYIGGEREESLGLGLDFSVLSKYLFSR